jgi:hypothetical protein
VKIQQVLSKSSFSGCKCISQEKADDLIVKYVVNDMRPLRTVESDSFKVLVTGLNPAVTVMCRKTLRGILKNKYDSDSMLQTLKSELGSTRYICTTADIWSSAHRSFLGMTAHWFGTDGHGSLRRKSAALACMRFKGKHSYDHIAAGISQTHAHYDIEEKVLKTCTDNGSNMVKCFTVSKQLKQQHKQQTKLAFETIDSSEEDDTDDDESLQDKDACQLDNLNDIVDDHPVEEGVVLPSHMRCCSHTLNLVATTDAEVALSDPAYKKIYRSSMAKATAIWNATSRSTKAADAAYDIVKRRFLVPCPTRWNSYYDAVKCIVQAESHLRDVCAVLSLPALLQQELAFLSEYVALMEPVARALDTLQGDWYACLGFVLPTLKSLKTKLNGVPLSLAKPLHAALIAGINKRFGHLFDDSEFLLASVSHPKFKTSWIDDPELKLRCSMLLLNAVQMASDECSAAPVQSMSTVSTTDAGGDTDSSDFFNDLNVEQTDQPHLKYLQDSSREIDMLNKHPAVKPVFLRFNSTIPSSAPVERLFSTGAIILSKRRNRLSDKTFETLLLLKINQDFW